MQFATADSPESSWDFDSVILSILDGTTAEYDVHELFRAVQHLDGEWDRKCGGIRFQWSRGQRRSTIAVGKSIDAGTNYFITMVLTVVWNSGPGNKNIQIVTPTNFSLDAWAIPEPGTLGPAVAALALFGFVRRRRQRTR
jgi:hypothetical protein